MWPTIPADLSELTDDELAALLEECVAYATEVGPTIATAEDVANLATLATGVESIRGEVAARDAAAEQIATDAAAALSRIVPAAETPEDPPAEDDEDDEGGESEEPPGDTPPPDAGGETPPTADAPAVPIAAATRMPLSEMARRAPAATRPRPAAHAGRVTITASADVPGFSPGQRLRTIPEIAAALIERHHTLGPSRDGGPEDRVPVVRFTLDQPAERRLSSQDGAAATQARINSFARQGQALTAAGGLCAPTEGYYDQLVIAEAARPVRDFLANFGADRGGIRFNPPPKMADITQGFGTVTAAQDTSGVTVADGVLNSTTLVTSATAAFTQADVGRTITGTGIPAGTTITAVASATNATMSQAATATASSVSITIGRGSKATFVVTCPAVQEVIVQAIYSSIQFGNFLGRSFPEQVQAWTSLMAAVVARTAETALLDGIAAKSTAVTAAGLVGGGREILARIGQGAMGYRSRNRMDPNATLDVLLPAWVPDMIAADMVRTFSDDAEMIEQARARAGAWLAARNVRVGWYLDSKTGGGQIIGAQAAGVLDQFPAHCFAYLYASGTFLHLDAGTLDLGLVRDSVLNANNNFRMFSEVFENIAMVGVESLEIDMSLQPTGAYSAAVTVANPIIT